jgi:hypothetical protein
MSESVWEPLDNPSIEGSGQTFVLPRQAWPAWAQRSTQFERLWIHCPDTEHPITSSETTAAVVARILTERFDHKDKPRPYNYNYYLIVKSTSGEVLQSGPLRTSDISRHSSQPPDVLDTYEPPHW